MRKDKKPGKASRWFYIEFVLGLILILSGAVTFFLGEDGLISLTIFYGILALIVGGADIAFYVRRAGKFEGAGYIFSLIGGILCILAGLILILKPVSGSLTILYVFPIWIIAHSISRLCQLSAIRVRLGQKYFYFTLVIGVAGLVIGASMLIAPVMTVMLAGRIISIYMLLAGFDLIIDAFGKKKAREA